MAIKLIPRHQIIETENHIYRTTTQVSCRKNTQRAPVPSQQRTLLFVPLLLRCGFWSNIRCEVEESALSGRGDGAQGSRQGAADECEKRTDVVTTSKEGDEQ